MLVGRIAMNNDWLDIDVVYNVKDNHYIVKRIYDYIVIDSRNNKEVGVHNNMKSAKKHLTVLNEDKDNTTI